MKEQWLSVAEIVALMEAFQKNNMGALKLKNGDQAILLKSREVQVQAAAAPQQTVVVQQNTGGEESAPPLPGDVVTSPIVGTFYAAPAPDKDPYVAVGRQVKKGDVLFLIESMKLMNEVLSECEGTVTQILVENAQAVEYGQPILCIE